MTKVWLITGTSSGFGRVWSEAALQRGDLVAATARNVESLRELVDTYGDAVLPLTLDVTDQPGVDAAVAAAHERFGRIDVVINNAGYGVIGMVEEVTPEQARRQVETNLLGPMWVTRAVLPILRTQGSGHIIQVSSTGGVLAFPMLGVYHATKWGLEGYTESLAAEVAHLGINITMVEPAGYDTLGYTKGAVYTDPIDAYAPLREKMAAGGLTLADPQNTAPVILDIVDATPPPLRVIFGDGSSFDAIRGIYTQRLEAWDAARPLSDRAWSGA